MRKGVVAALLLSVVALGACGSSAKSDKDKISDLIKDVGKNPAALCTKYATSGLMAQIGGPTECTKLSKKPNAQDPNVRIDSIEVTGSDASAKVTGSTGAQQIRLVKRAGSWKVSTVTGSGQ